MGTVFSVYFIERSSCKYAEVVCVDVCNVVIQMGNKLVVCDYDISMGLTDIPFTKEMDEYESVEEAIEGFYLTVGKLCSMNFDTSRFWGVPSLADHQTKGTWKYDKDNPEMQSELSSIYNLIANI